MALLLARVPALPVWVGGTLVLYGVGLVAALALAFTSGTAHSPDVDDYLRGR